MNVVSTRFGDGIHRTTCKTGLTYIKRDDINLYLFNSFHRYRLCTGWTAIGTVSCQPVNIIVHHSVDTETVVAVVGSQKKHGTVVITAYLRIHPEHIGNTMGDRRYPIDRRRIDIHRRTGFRGIYPGTGRDNHFRKQFGSFGHFHIMPENFAQFQINSSGFTGLHTDK